MLMPDIAWITERDLAKRMGVSRSWIRAMRASLDPGELYGKAGCRVMWSEKGVAVLQKKAGARDPDATPEPPTPGVPEKLTITRLVINPHLVLAATKKGAVVRVRVRLAANFMPGMEIQARKIDGDLFELVGRCPRFKGRW
jgi:hypothetical protein